MKKHQTRCHAFTLIELLAVTVIISILAGMVFMAAGRVRASANSSKCLANQRQIALTLIMDAQERGTFCPGVASTGTWPTVVAARIGIGSLFLCPDRSINPTKASSLSYVYSNYSVNPIIMPDLVNNKPVTPASPLNVPRPSEVILVADGCLRSSDGGAQARFWQVETTNSTAPDPESGNFIISDGPDTDNGSACFRFRHDGRVNVAFVDGHLDSLTKGTIRQRNLHIKY